MQLALKTHEIKKLPTILKNIKMKQIKWIPLIKETRV
jgi:hypothetical protein